MVNEKRLIDANATKTIIQKEMNKSDFQQFKDVMQCVCNILDYSDTVDAAEVVHGRWVFGTANHREYMKCSECLHSYTPDGTFCYCPNCGAKMDGDGNG